MLCNENSALVKCVSIQSNNVKPCITTHTTSVQQDECSSFVAITDTPTVRFVISNLAPYLQSDLLAIYIPNYNPLYDYRFTTTQGSVVELDLNSYSLNLGGFADSNITIKLDVYLNDNIVATFSTSFYVTEFAVTYKINNGILQGANTCREMFLEVGLDVYFNGITEINVYKFNGSLDIYDLLANRFRGGDLLVLRFLCPMPDELLEYRLASANLTTLYIANMNNATFIELSETSNSSMREMYINFNNSTTDIGSFFIWMRYLTKVNLQGLDSILDASYLFNGSSSLNDITLGSMDNVIDITGMFRITDIITCNFNFPKATELRFIFDACPSLSGNFVLSVDSANVLEKLFTVANSITKMTISASSLTSVENDMLSYATNLKTFNFIGGASLLSIPYMFFNCANLESVKFDSIKNVVDFRGVFYQCPSLVEINLGSDKPTAELNLSGTFYLCESLTYIPFALSGVKVTNLDFTFKECTSLLNTIDLNTDLTTSFFQSYYRASSLTNIPYMNISSASLLTTELMFSECSSLLTHGGVSDCSLLSSDAFIGDSQLLVVPCGLVT